MEAFFDELTGYLFRQGVHIAVLFGAIGLVCVLARKRTAHLRYLLWLVIVAKCLAPSLMTVSLAILPGKAEVVKPALAERVPIIVDMPVDSGPEYVVNIEKPVAVTNESSLISLLGEFSEREWFGMIWLGGVVLFGLIVSFKAVRFHGKLKKLREPVGDGLYDEVFELAGDQTSPAVWLLRGVGQPFVWGVLRGSIYLPAGFGKSTDAEHRRKILAHELAHISRYDAFVNLLQILAQGVFWFHPLVWIANRQIRAEREKCCDETAIARLAASPRDYSNAIVDTLITEYKSTLPTPSLAIAGPIRNIEDRIKTIMKPGKRFYKSPTLVAIAVVLLLGVAVVPTTIALTERQSEQVIRQWDKSEVIELVEDFFKDNWKDVTARKSLGWGEPVVDKDGNVSIVYQFESTILGKDLTVSEKIFTFDRKGNFVSTKDVKQVAIEMMVFSVDDGSGFLESHFGIESVGKFLILNEEQRQKLKDPRLSPPMKHCIASPKVLLMDGETAKVSTGENLDYADAETGASKLDVKMTPHVGRNGAVLLELDISMKTLDGRDDSDNLIISARQIVTSFTVGEGKTTLLELAGKSGSKDSQDDGERIFAIVKPVVVEPPEEGEVHAVAAANRMNGLRRVATPPKAVSKVIMTKESDSQTPEEQVLIDMQLISVESRSAFFRDRLGAEPGTILVLTKDQKDRLEDIGLSPAGIEWIARPKVLVNDRSTARLKATQSIDNPDDEKPKEHEKYEPEFDIAITPHVSDKGVIRLELGISLKAKVGVDGSGKAIINAREIETQVAVENGKTTLLELAGRKDSEETMFVIITPVVVKPTPEECEELSAIEESDQLTAFPDDEKVERVLSASKMRSFALAWFMYADDNDDRIAKSLKEMEPYIEKEVLSWAQENVEFIAISGKHKEITAPQNRPIAYDKTLLQKRGETNVAFADGHAEYCDIDRLDKLGLVPDVVKRVKSMEKLKHAGLMLFIYANEHDDKLPSSLDELKPYDKNDLLGWMKDSVEYLAEGVDLKEIADTGKYPIAIDKKLSRQLSGVSVLFADGHVELFLDQTPPHLVDVIGPAVKTKKQVEIESRFIMVDEDFLEDVGLGSELGGDNVAFLPKKESELKIEAIVSSGTVDKPSSFNVEVEAAFLDDSQADILIKTTQKHSDSSMLTAPRVTVVDLERAVLKIVEEVPFVAGYKDGNRFRAANEPVAINDYVETGTTLSITPRIKEDGKHCVLELEAKLSELGGYDRRRYRKRYSYDIPQIEVLEFKCTGLYVPAGKTLLIYAPWDSSVDKKVVLMLVKPKVAEAKVNVPAVRPSMGGSGISGFGSGVVPAKSGD